MAESRDTFEFLTANLGAPDRRWKAGREYLVAPATIFPPGGGVMNGSKGPLFYSNDTCSSQIGAWNGFPLTGRHPATNDGKHVSANYPGMKEKQHIGFLANDRMDGDKRKVDCWYDIEATKDFDLLNKTSILADAEAGRLQEVSTGLKTSDNPAQNGANYNGKSYSWVVSAWEPDHLAVLPDQRGACAIKDGCGVFNCDCSGKSVDDMCDSCKEKELAANAGRYGNPQSGNTGRFKSHGAGIGKGDSHEAAQSGSMMITERDRELGRDAKQELVETGHNPASWVADEDIWEKAKAAADKSYDADSDEYWAVVAHIYKQMGGEVKGSTENIDNTDYPWDQCISDMNCYILLLFPT